MSGTFYLGMGYKYCYNTKASLKFFIKAMANKNTGLRAARLNKKDEFYTQLQDIENELRHYRGHFEGKTVYCNCDDPTVSITAGAGTASTVNGPVTRDFFLSSTA